MPRKLSLRDIKSIDKAHPYSRKASQVNRVIQRASKLDSRKSTSKTTRQDPVVERFLWFKYAMDPDSKCLSSSEEEHQLVQQYIDRHSDELQDLISKNRKGQPPHKANRQHWLSMLIDKERREYEKSGFRMPDLTDCDNVLLLRRWEGDFNAMWQFKTKELLKIGK